MVREFGGLTESQQLRVRKMRLSSPKILEAALPKAGVDVEMDRG